MKPTYRTLAEIEASEKTILCPQDVCGYLHCDAYSINLQAQRDPSVLGFPVIVTGSRVRIPKEAFVRFCKGLDLWKAERTV